MECEGSCEEHRGEIIRVHVIGSYGFGHDWGYFFYCEEARVEDINRGFAVIPVENEELEQPND